MRIETEVFQPPTRGLITSANVLAPPPDSAVVLDNFFPSEKAPQMRRGSQLFATLGAAPKRLFAYHSGSASALIAATASKVYDITSPADSAVEPTAALSSLTSGDWSTVQTSTAGGDFLVAVNGADTGFYYDGTTFTAYGGGTDIADGGATVDSTDMMQVSSFKQRLFFVENDSMNVWYLPVDSIAGTLNKLALGSVFNRGGRIVFAATWSLDGGEGLDDKWVVVSSEGEAAIYAGTDPSSSSAWFLQGVYVVGKPLNKHAFIKNGGELLIITEEGIIPISQVIRASAAPLPSIALTYPIDNVWEEAVTNRAGNREVSWSAYDERGAIYIGTEARATGGRVTLVMNQGTNAWSRYIGWDVYCLAQSGGNLYFGNGTAQVYRAETGGTDDGTAYEAVYAPAFSLCGTPARKWPKQLGVTFRSAVQVRYGATCFADFATKAARSGPILAEDESAAVFGAAKFGSATWGGSGAKRATTQWKTVRGPGMALSPCISLQSNGSVAPDAEVMAVQLRYEVGAQL